MGICEPAWVKLPHASDVPYIEHPFTIPAYSSNLGVHQKKQEVWFIDMAGLSDCFMLCLKHNFRASFSFQVLTHRARFFQLTSYLTVHFLGFRKNFSSTLHRKIHGIPGTVEPASNQVNQVQFFRWCATNHGGKWWSEAWNTIVLHHVEKTYTIAFTTFFVFFLESDGFFFP